MRVLANCLRRCKQLGILPTRWIFIASISGQRAELFQSVVVQYGRARHSVRAAQEGLPGFRRARSDAPYHLVRRVRISTSRFGIGQSEGSNCTPLGLHRIAEKIGGGWPVGTVFKSRQPVGFTWKGMPDAKVTTRILWLEGLEPGFNRAGNVDSHSRYIYIHGTGDETTLGRPASCGCIHLAADDLIPLHDKLPCGTLVWISER